jgi:hypothetical protein
VQVEVTDAAPPLPCAAIAQLRCRRCRTSVVRVALATRLELLPACRHGRALDVLYHEGLLTVWICSHDTGHMWEEISPHLPQRLDIQGNQSECPQPCQCELLAHGQHQMRAPMHGALLDFDPLRVIEFDQL